MLDKTIPHKRILMKRPKGEAWKEYELPAGYTFCHYEEGNEQDWAEIETSVGEFDNIESALKYYNKEFMPYAEELKRRQMFIQAPNKQLIATVSAWWKLAGERRDPILHWVAARPEYQGKGLGKALVSEGIKRIVQLEGDVDMYLSTQTWSYKAVNIYLDAGFEMLEATESYGGYKNENAEAVQIVRDKLKSW